MFVHSARRAARWRCSRAEGADPRVLIKSELAEPGHRGASQDILVESLSRGRPRLRVRIWCVQRALRRSTHRIPCWRPRPSHTRPTPTSRASVLPEVTTAGSRRRQAASELESRHANRLSHQTLRNSRSLESSRGVGWGHTRQGILGRGVLKKVLEDKKCRARNGGFRAVMSVRNVCVVVIVSGVY